jgi:hypothetical protein
VNTWTTWTAVVCALGALAGCTATKETGAHATAAAAVRGVQEEAAPVVHVRAEPAGDRLALDALDVVRRTLAEHGFDVAEGSEAARDADLVVRVGGGRTTLMARVGARAMVPVTVDGVDDDAVEEACVRWQRRMRRAPRLERHFEEPADGAAIW